MKGNNTLELNEAALIEAMQEYLDRRMTDYAPKVTAVKSSRIGLSDGFTVHVEARTREPSAGALR